MRRVFFCFYFSKRAVWGEGGGVCCHIFLFCSLFHLVKYFFGSVTNTLNVRNNINNNNNYKKNMPSRGTPPWKIRCSRWYRSRSSFERCGRRSSPHELRSKAGRKSRRSYKTFFVRQQIVRGSAGSKWKGFRMKPRAFFKGMGVR